MSLVQLDRAVNVEKLREELQRELEGEVRFDQISRALYSNDASVYQIEPLGVVVPKSREDIVRVVQICGRHRCPITMRGGGTSQAGQAIGEGLVVDTSKYYNQILEINAEQLWVRVQPGIVLDELNAELAPLGVRFAPDISTASRATIGGMMANNSAGARSVLYGITIHHVLEQIVVLADASIAHFRDMDRNAIPTGDTLEAAAYATVLRLASELVDEIERRYPKVLRRVGGYNLNEFTDRSRPVNLAKMMVGSEGTLGVVLEAKLSLVRLPKAKAVMVIGFPDLLESLAAAPLILKHSPSAIEVMDKSILDNTRQNVALDHLRRSVIEGDPASTLCVEFYADRKEDLPPRLEGLERDLRSQNLGYQYRAEMELAGQAKIWSLREAALGLSMAMKDDAKSIPFVEDTAVAPERLSSFIGRFLQIVRKHQTTAGIYAHASVGCLHVRPVLNLKTDAGVRHFEEIAEEVADLVLEYGGALSGEHGDGLVRSPFMRRMFGDQLYAAFQEIKRTFDPHGIFNPGKIVDSPPLASNLRFGPSYRGANPKTWFDYSEYGGIAGAFEMCSGVGACRKKLSGTMCPSYMATREESASTRGRANVLRLAISGRLHEAGLGDQGVYTALDLCLQCRACKSECPVGVDMARFKSEFLADYYARHGLPWRAKALGRVHQLSVWGSRFAPVSNWIAGSAMARSINEWLLGLDARRKPPAWKRLTFERWLEKHPRAGSNGARMVALFNDTFTNHFEPEIGVAALEILERGGYGVQVVRPACCGRPLISQGLLEEAQKNAATLVNGLYPIAKRGEEILFCEPSCLSAVKDDVPGLLRGEGQAKAREVAQAARLFEEFGAQLALPIKQRPGKIIFHGHCHQKSLDLLSATTSFLSRIPEAKLVTLDAGCCGMAGSFGYAKEHYDVSVAIANRRLLPAVKHLEPGDVVVAPGTSCRRQLDELANVQALHPVVLMRDLLL